MNDRRTYKSKTMNPRHNPNIALLPLNSPTHFQFGTWDCEASAWWDLQCIGCFDGKDYYWFKTVEEFLNHIMRWEYRHWRWFAHFGGRYDLNFVFDVVRKRSDWNVSFYCSGSMVLQMAIRKGDCHAKLCDSFRLLPAALRDLTVAFNVAHQKTKYDFAEMHLCKELLEYNEQDCRGLYEVLEMFFEQTGLRSETFATHSLRVFRKDYLREPIYKPHDSITEFVRESYHGGRVEVYKRQNPLVTAYDVNSMYPYVMQQELPVQYVAQSNRLRDDYFGFVHASITVPERYIPVLPVRQEKLFFPVGKLQAVWSNEELLVAENMGCKIEKIHKAVYFRTAPVFREYVQTLYKMKKGAPEPQRTIAKYLLNSFYGKFGQSPTKRVYVMEEDAPNHAWPIITPDGKPSGFAYYERTSHAAYLLPHLASAVTSKARLHLLTKLNEAVYYCDTDSVFTTETMDTGNELGEWGLVGSGECMFIQPKLYKFKGTWKAKGLDRTQSIDDYVLGDINKVVRRKSIKEALRDGSNACMDVIIEKRLRETRPKRPWISEQDTRPWNMKELEKKGKAK